MGWRITRNLFIGTDRIQCVSKTVVTNVVAITVNEVSEEEENSVLEASDEIDSLDDLTTVMEQDVEQIIEQRVFGDADSVPILDVSTDVYDGDIKEEDLERP